MNSYLVYGENVRLVAFFYELMRDEMPVGQVEALVRSCARTLNGEPLEECKFTNEHLARYAEELVDRLVQ